MKISIEYIETLLLIAAIVAMTARRLRIPYTVGLIIAGIVLAVTPFPSDIEVTKDLIFTILLPPLIYEAAIYIKWQELRRDLLCNRLFRHDHLSILRFPVALIQRVLVVNFRELAIAVVDFLPEP